MLYVACMVFLWLLGPELESPGPIRYWGRESGSGWGSSESRILPGWAAKWMVNWDGREYTRNKQSNYWLSPGVKQQGSKLGLGMWQGGRGLQSLILTRSRGWEGAERLHRCFVHSELEVLWERADGDEIPMLGLTSLELRWGVGLAWAHGWLAHGWKVKQRAEISPTEEAKRRIQGQTGRGD